VALLHELEMIWLRHERANADLVITSGELYTDAALHGPSKISGETNFVIDIRSVSDAIMDTVAAEAQEAAARIGEAYRVKFDLGTATYSPPAMMDERIQACLRDLLDRPFEMSSGAGHDAAIFEKMGVPTGMILVRNDHGSHNPDEAMELDDFAVATRALIGLLLELPL
jgi:beta-ureidopropionase / N-carbamoyl-L-amino-acid hydrolase